MGWQGRQSTMFHCNTRDCHIRKHLPTGYSLHFYPLFVFCWNRWSCGLGPWCQIWTQYLPPCCGQVFHPRFVIQWLLPSPIIARWSHTCWCKMYGIREKKSIFYPKVWEVDAVDPMHTKYGNECHGGLVKDLSVDPKSWRRVSWSCDPLGVPRRHPTDTGSFVSRGWSERASKDSTSARLWGTRVDVCKQLVRPLRRKAHSWLIKLFVLFCPFVVLFAYLVVLHCNHARQL